MPLRDARSLQPCLLGRGGLGILQPRRKSEPHVGMSNWDMLDYRVCAPGFCSSRHWHQYCSPLGRGDPQVYRAHVSLYKIICGKMPTARTFPGNILSRLLLNLGDLVSDGVLKEGGNFFCTPIPISFPLSFLTATA